MQTIKIGTSEHIIVNPKKDNCVICGTPLKDVYFSWLIFHGRAKASCCGVPYQLKSYSPRDDATKEEKAFIKSLDKPDRIEFSVDSEWIEPIKRAMKETGIRDVNNDKVYDLAKSYKEGAI